jgi:hypothetical protein
MAGSVTHTYFSKDVLKKLDKDTRSIISENIDYFEIFNQGHDIFMFGGINGKKLSNIYHSSKTRDFFINLINYIRANRLQNNGEIMAFLYGFLCHYSLDSITHPYIIYKGGYYNKKKNETLKYNGGHDEVETYIDSYLINKNENIKPGCLDVSKFCFKKKKISKELIKLIDEVFKKTYNKKNMGNYYKKGLKRMKLLYHLLRYDKKGKKKKFYILLDNIRSNKSFQFKNVSYNVKLNKNLYFLNTNKRQWNHPMYKNEKYNESFNDLYKKAIKMSIDLINASNAVLFYNKTSNYLKKYFNNYSFISGKSCNDKKEFKYFQL